MSYSTRCAKLYRHRTGQITLLAGTRSRGSTRRFQVRSADRRLETLTTSQGCVPPWIQILSGDTAPLKRCDCFHAELSKKNRSHLQQLGYGVYSEFFSSNVNKVSQWTTLLIWHANLLQRHENDIHQRWRHLATKNCIRIHYDKSDDTCSNTATHGALDVGRVHLDD
jgi:hypothetical protein